MAAHSRRSRIQSPTGTTDTLPGDADRRDEVEAAARRIFTAAGYSRIDTPYFESTDLFVRGVGTSTDIVRKQMYTFEDDAGRSLTLRPEGTAAICRAYVQHGMHKLPHPLRFWFYGNYFRQEKPQAGRLCQFSQIGVETLGSDDPAVDAECMTLLTELFETMRVPGLRLRISSLGMPETRFRYTEKLAKYLHAHADRLSAEVRARIDSNPLRAFDAKHPGTQAVMAGAPRLVDDLARADLEHFNEVRALLDSVGVAYELDWTLVRGLDYYTRTVFEFTADGLGAQNAVGGGGRFDHLVTELGGTPTPACGGCAGVERLLLSTDGPAPGRPPGIDLFVAVTGAADKTVAFRLAATARRSGLTAQLGEAGRRLAGQLKQADRAGAGHVAILGGGRAVLKELSTGGQIPVEIEEVVPELLSRRQAIGASRAGARP